MSVTTRERPAATEAFDRLAPAYDALACGDAFLRQRRQCHAAFTRWLRPGCRVLEIGCGTGVDTEFLARSGMRVVACDPSEGMLSVAGRRVATAGVGDRVRMLACGLGDVAAFLGAFDHDEGFDAIVSNFGALNCVASLGPLGTVAARHLRPGGAVMIGLMGRACAWEAFYFAATRRAPLAARRRQARVTVPVAGVDVPTFYHRTADVGAALGNRFVLDTVMGLGVMVPPPYLEARWQRVPPGVRDALSALDRLVASWPVINGLGDHVLSRWLKRRNAHA